MGRRRSPHIAPIIERILQGVPNKEIAYEFGVGNTLICRTAANYDLKRQYVTDAEFRQILEQRKRNLLKTA